MSFYSRRWRKRPKISSPFSLISLPPTKKQTGWIVSSGTPCNQSRKTRRQKFPPRLTCEDQLARTTDRSLCARITIKVLKEGEFPSESLPCPPCSHFWLLAFRSSTIFHVYIYGLTQSVFIGVGLLFLVGFFCFF